MPKKPKKEDEVRYRTESYLQYLDRRDDERRIAKETPKVIYVSSQDKYDIGMLSSVWESFKPLLHTKFNETRAVGFTRANDIANLWNRGGFKTASGQLWTPKLVNIGKDILGIKHYCDVIYQES